MRFFYMELEHIGLSIFKHRTDNLFFSLVMFILGGVPVPLVPEYPSREKTKYGADLTRGSMLQKSNRTRNSYNVDF